MGNATTYGRSLNIPIFPEVLSGVLPSSCARTLNDRVHGSLPFVSRPSSWLSRFTCLRRLKSIASGLLVGVIEKGLSAPVTSLAQ